MGRSKATKKRIQQDSKKTDGITTKPRSQKPHKLISNSQLNKRFESNYISHQEAQVDENQNQPTWRELLQSQDQWPERRDRRKYRKINYYERQRRVQKSKYERIYLLQATRRDEEWKFLVKGTSGSNYHIQLSTTAKCTCPDFVRNQMPCKHIFFIVTKVAQNEWFLQEVGYSGQITKQAYNILDDQLVSRLKQRLEDNKDKQQKAQKEEQSVKKVEIIDLKDETDCVICFLSMQKQTQVLQNCGTCKKYFHSQCLSAWKSHNNSCPLCRGLLENTKHKQQKQQKQEKYQQLNDPLAKLTNVQL